MEKQKKQSRGSKAAAGRTSIRVDNVILEQVKTSKKDTGVNVGVFYDKAAKEKLARDAVATEAQRQNQVIPHGQI
jgi:hypothetical protein